MERKDFLKNACAYGFCGCMGMSFLTGNPALAGTPAEPAVGDEPDWRIDFMQNRYRDLIYILDSTLDDETFIKVLNQLGAKCGTDLANRFKGDPEGFFTFIKSRWADSVEYNKEEGIITVNEKVRDTCNCPFIPQKDAPSILCNCSLGTQKKIYENLYGRPVHVTLNKSILHGDERCSFTIKLL